MRIKMIVASALILFSSLAASYDLFGSSYSRGPQGEVSEYSAEQLDRMISAAKSRGQIAIWITFDVPFAQDPTPEQIQETQDAVAAAFQEAVMPLVHRGHASVIELPVTLEGSPGMLVSINAQGLRKLAEEDTVKYLGYFQLDD